MRAHLVQFDIAWENKRENYRRVAALLEKADPAVRPGDLIVLPELFDTGFSFATGITHDGDGQTLDFIQDLARRYRATVQGARTVIGPDGRGRNRATIAGPDGSILAEYEKIHPFSFGRESEYFSGGDSIKTYLWMHNPSGSVGDASAGAGAAPVTSDAVVVCPAICYDLRFPELFRRGLLAGAEVFAIGANWPAPRAMHRRALLIARAIENQAFVLGVNRVGRDPHLEYAGETCAIGPKGEVLAELGDQEGVLAVDLDLDSLHQWRETFPAWRDIRLIG